MRLYVGNLSWGTTDDKLRSLFARYGGVAEAKVITDRDTGRSKGFGFVELTAGGEEAMAALDGTDFDGREIKVSPAKEKPRAGGGGHGGGHRENDRDRRGDWND